MEFSMFEESSGLVTLIPSSPRLAWPRGFGGHLIHNLKQSLAMLKQRRCRIERWRWTRMVNLQKKTNHRHTLADKVVPRDRMKTKI
jgi:hypothetical protein